MGKAENQPVVGHSFLSLKPNRHVTSLTKTHESEMLRREKLSLFKSAD
jgi:hypothetical protein